MGVSLWIPTTLLWFVAFCSGESEVKLPVQCTLPLQEGDCEAMMLRWYFDPASGQCERFFFKGCNANENNFLSFEECESACRPLQEDTFTDSNNFEKSEGKEIAEENLNGKQILQTEKYSGNENEDLQKDYQDPNQNFQNENQDYVQDNGQEEEMSLEKDIEEPVFKDQVVPDSVDTDVKKEEMVEEKDKTEEKKEEIPAGIKIMVQQIANVEEKEEQRRDSLMTDSFTNLDQINKDLNIKRPVEVDDNMSPVKIADAQYSLEKDQELSSGEGETPLWNEGDLDRNLKSGASLQPVLEEEKPDKDTENKEPERCGLSMEGGLCKARMLKWYYKKELNMCLPFVYGGCGGNKNRFETLEECSNICQGKTITEDSPNYKMLKKPSIILTLRAGKKLAKMSPWLQQKYGPRIHKVINHLETQTENIGRRFFPRNIPRRFSLPMIVPRIASMIQKSSEESAPALINKRIERLSTPNLLLPTTAPPIYPEQKYDAIQSQNENSYEKEAGDDKIIVPVQKIMENEVDQKPEYLPGRRRIMSAFTTPLVHRLPFFRIFFRKVVSFDSDERKTPFDTDNESEISSSNSVGMAEPIEENSYENNQRTEMPYQRNQFEQPGMMEGQDYSGGLSSSQEVQSFRERKDEIVNEKQEEETNEIGQESESDGVIEAQSQDDERYADEIQVKPVQMLAAEADQERDELIRMQENRINEGERGFYDDRYSSKFWKKPWWFRTKYGRRKDSRRDGVKLVQVFVNKFGTHQHPAPPGGSPHQYGAYQQHALPWASQHQRPGLMQYNGEGPMVYHRPGYMAYRTPPHYGTQHYYNYIQQRDNEIRHLAIPHIMQPGGMEVEGEDTTSDPCQLPATRGPCFNLEMKWYYNKEKNICDLFAFSGCGGNGNRFSSAEECYMTCIFEQKESAPAESEPPTPESTEDEIENTASESIDKEISDDVDEPNRLETLQMTDATKTTPSQGEPKVTSTTTTSKPEAEAKETHSDNEKTQKVDTESRKSKEANVPDFLETSVRKLHAGSHVQYATTMFVLCGVAVALLVLMVVSTVVFFKHIRKPKTKKEMIVETMIHTPVIHPDLPKILYSSPVAVHQPRVVQQEQ